jgi:hypothetical protein
VARPSRGFRGILAAVAILAAGPSVARAEPTAAEKETARALMNEGRDLRDQRDFKGALGRFQAADAIMHVPTTGLEVARTQVSLGLLVEARETLHRVSQFALKPTDPPPFREARSEAERLNDELEGRIGAIRFEVRLAGNDAPPTVFVDGVRIQQAGLTVPFRVNPGRHDVVAKSPSGEINKQVNARERETSTVVLDFSSASPIAAAPAGAEPTSAASSSTPWRTLGYVGLGVGAVGIGVGAVTGLLAISSKHEAESRCVGNKCPPDAWSDVDKMHEFGRISTAGFLVGALGVAGGVSLLVLAPKDSGASLPAQGAVRLVPTGTGMVLVGGF